MKSLAINRAWPPVLVPSNLVNPPSVLTVASPAVLDWTNVMNPSEVAVRVALPAVLVFSNTVTVALGILMMALPTVDPLRKFMSI